MVGRSRKRVGQARRRSEHFHIPRDCGHSLRPRDRDAHAAVIATPDGFSQEIVADFSNPRQRAQLLCPPFHVAVGRFPVVRRRPYGFNTGVDAIKSVDYIGDKGAVGDRIAIGRRAMIGRPFCRRKSLSPSSSTTPQRFTVAVKPKPRNPHPSFSRCRTCHCTFPSLLFGL